MSTHVTVLHLLSSSGHRVILRAAGGEWIAGSKLKNNIFPIMQQSKVQLWPLQAPDSVTMELVVPSE